MRRLFVLALAGLVAGVFPAPAQAAPGVLDHVALAAYVEYLLPGDEFKFWAGGFDTDDAPISGLTFTWSVVNQGGTIIGTGTDGPYSYANFKAGATLGTFYNTVQVVAAQGTTTRSATATVTVVAYPPYVYEAENGKCQLIDSPGTDNCVDWSWSGLDPALPPPYQLYWGASTPPDVPIKADIEAVIGNWQAAIPYLPYQESTSEHPPRLIFYYQTEVCGPDALGCHSVTATNTTYDANQRASYWKTATIEINRDNVPSPGALARGIIAHEIGHHYGLDERYFVAQTPFGLLGVCNQYEGTAVNLVASDDPNCPLRNGPTGLDKQRVDMFWRGGTPLTGVETRGDLPILANGNGPIATYRWQDLAWAEISHLIVFQYLDDDVWTEITETSSPYWAGVHLYTEPRTVTMEIDVRNYPSIPDTSTHRACSWAYYAAAGYHYGSENGWGNDKCSDPVILTRPPPP
ncbi:MAG: hypothetical protein HY671_04115 [Chloroflexi bacterium]|nr:hypothetical protein [Chloroflexota bacterium]